jgi:WD40 repeat protein
VFRSSLLRPGGCLSPDGRWFALGERRGIHLWDLGAGKVRFVPYRADALGCEPIEFTSDGRHVLVVLSMGGYNRAAALIDLSSDRVTLCGKWDARKFVSDGGHLALVHGRAHVLRVAHCDDKDEETIAEVWGAAKGDGRRRSIGRFFAAGGYLLAATDGKGKLGLFRLPQLTPLRHIDAGCERVESLAVSADGKRIACAGKPAGPCVHDAASGKLLARMKGDVKSCVSLAFSPDGRFLSGFDALADRRYVWDAASGRRLGAIDLAGRRARSRGWRQAGGTAYVPWPAVDCPFAFSPNGSLLAVEMGDGVEVIVLPSFERYSDWKVPPLLEVQKVCFAPDGRTVVLWGGRRPTFWDALTGSPVHAPAGHLTPIDLVGFSPDGRFCFRQTADRLGLFDLKTEKGRRLATARSLSGVGFSDDGKALVTHSDERVCLWQVASGRQLAQHHVQGAVDLSGGRGKVALIEGTGKRPACILDLVTGRRLALPEASGRRAAVRSQVYWTVSHDGRLLAVGEENVALYELATGGLITRWPGDHLGGLTSVDFSPDGRTLATGGMDATVLLWDWKNLCRLSGQRRGRLDEGRLRLLWRTLTEEDAREAYRAMGTLIAHPDLALKFLRKELSPVTPGELRDFVRAVEDLDSDDFDVREAAQARLKDLPLEWVTHLRGVRDSKVSLEVRRRVARLLRDAAQKRYSPAMLRRLRAVQILEEIGTSDARKLLAAIARGHEDSPLAAHSKAALVRLSAKR